MNKKMILAVMEEIDSDHVIRVLQDLGHTLTLIDSTGSLLRRGDNTVIIGVDENEVDDVINLIRQESDHNVNPFKKTATVLVIDVDHFEQIP